MIFAVKDSGIGIPPATCRGCSKSSIAARIARRSPNAALGWDLPSSNPLRNVTGEKVWVESELGKGSTFFFAEFIDATEENVHSAETYIASIEKDLKGEENPPRTYYRSAGGIFARSLVRGIAASSDPKHIGCGAPDFIVEKGKVPLGYVETEGCWRTAG
ncbi:MAG: hypothetical protein M0C28_33340 [Candidatus Moduliflexus flocculans]|nr:hypothetical protein [Candidatus Moduliflexus flocculans]